VEWAEGPATSDGSTRSSQDLWLWALHALRDSLEPVESIFTSKLASYGNDRKENLMTDLPPLEGATPDQMEAFLKGLQDEARKHVRERLASGASAAEITDYIASLEPPSADAVLPDGGDEL